LEHFSVLNVCTKKIGYHDHIFKAYILKSDMEANEKSIGVTVSVQKVWGLFRDDPGKLPKGATTKYRKCDIWTLIVDSC